MDNAWKQRLSDEAAALGLPLSTNQVDQLAGHVDLLLKWNAKVNLTRITEPNEVRVKHVLDALVGLRILPKVSTTVLDLGSGGGFPGIPWLIARPGLQVTMVDSVAKKVSFLKTALAQLRLGQGRAVHARLEGRPDAEGLHRASVVVSRAFTALGDFLALARSYLAPDGSAIAMLGPREGLEAARGIADKAGFDLVESVSVALPDRLGERIVVRAVPRGTTADKRA